MTRYALVATALLLVLAPVSGVSAAETDTATVSGTVTVAGGTADGDTVTVTPLTKNFSRAGDPVETTVSNGTFDASNVTRGQFYYVRLVHGDLAHYALVRNATGVGFDLSANLSGRVVTPDGEPVANATLGVQSATGAPVATVNTSESGTFEAGPVQPNRSYVLRLQRAGIPYRQRVETDANGTTARIVTHEPTSNESALSVAGGSPASHVVQVSPTQNGSGLTVVETMTVTNNGSRPFVGSVTLGLPDGARPTGAMYRDRSTQYRTEDGAVTVNASVAANASTRVGVAYTVPNRTLEKPLQHRTDRVAVVLRGYNLSRVSHSDNLRTGDMPLPMLTNGESLERGESIRVHLPGDTTTASQAEANDAPDSKSDSQSLPVDLLALALAGTVAASIVAYRVF